MDKFTETLELDEYPGDEVADLSEEGTLGTNNDAITDFVTSLKAWLDTLVDAVNKAQIDATNAVSAAATAQSTAEEAQTTASAAQAAAEAADTKATNAAMVTDETALQYAITNAIVLANGTLSKKE